MDIGSLSWTAAQLRHQVEAQGVTQSALSIALGASQSQISRVLSGRTSIRSKLARDICIYVSSRTGSMNREKVMANDDLMDALAKTWDGTPNHARALAAVIRSLTLLSSAPRDAA